MSCSPARWKPSAKTWSSGSKATAPSLPEASWWVDKVNRMDGACYKTWSNLVINGHTTSNVVIWKQGDRTISAGSIMVGFSRLGDQLGMSAKLTRRIESVTKYNQIRKQKRGHLDSPASTSSVLTFNIYIIRFITVTVNNITSINSTNKISYQQHLDHDQVRKDERMGLAKAPPGDGDPTHLRFALPLFF